MKDIIVFPMVANHQVRHKARRLMSSLHGDCNRPLPLFFLWSLRGHAWINIRTLSRLVVSNVCENLCLIY